MPDSFSFSRGELDLTGHRHWNCNFRVIALKEGQYNGRNLTFSLKPDRHLKQRSLEVPFTALKVRAPQSEAKELNSRKDALDELIVKGTAETFAVTADAPEESANAWWLLLILLPLPLILLLRRAEKIVPSLGRGPLWSGKAEKLTPGKP